MRAARRAPSGCARCETSASCAAGGRWSGLGAPKRSTAGARKKAMSAVLQVSQRACPSLRPRQLCHHGGLLLHALQGAPGAHHQRVGQPLLVGEDRQPAAGRVLPAAGGGAGQPGPGPARAWGQRRARGRQAAAAGGVVHRPAEPPASRAAGRRGGRRQRADSACAAGPDAAGGGARV